MENKKNIKKQEAIDNNIKTVKINLLIFAFLQFLLGSYLVGSKYIKPTNVAPSIFINYWISKTIIINRINKKKVNNVVAYTWLISFIVFIIREIIGTILLIFYLSMYR